MGSSELWKNQSQNFCIQFFHTSCATTERLDPGSWLMYIVMSGIVLVTIMGNLLVIILVSHFKQLHNATNVLILSLAVADFLVGLLVMPYSMVRTVTSCWYFGEVFCKMHTCFDVLLCTSSIFHLLFISVDRYYAICHPLHYYKKITTLVVEVFLLVSWSGPALYSFGLILSNTYTAGIQNNVYTVHCAWLCSFVLNKLWGSISGFICFIIPGLLMIGIYIHIFSIARQQAKAIANNANIQSDSKATSKKLYMTMERKAAKTLSLVMGAFVLCWLPFFTVTVVDPYINFEIPRDVYSIVLWLGYFNSTLNPIIYALFYPRFKKAFRYIITEYIYCRLLKTCVN
ncbi:trace amine-associated receptor 4-like [Hyperolius riggenbachi]|uniref:trace amine-associated receptor 4-like n=1 Tax=Hyperolius riggenbachi TaxID=752182 RepID=UPI0035A2E742